MAAVGNVKKLQRKSISLLTKVSVLDHLANGESVASVARKYNMNEATVRTIRKNEKAIRDAIVHSSDASAKVTSYARDPIVEKMEKALLIWIEEQQQKRIPVDGPLIREKASSLHNLFQQREPSTSKSVLKKFTASVGWFAGFIKRNSLHNVALKGECASADDRAATAFPEQLKEVITQGNYSPDQIFNCDETGLFWKKMPSRTYISKAEKCASGFKAAKERITLLFCSNASGDRLLKPLLLNRYARPRSMKNENFDSLPVHWMANNKAWVTKEIFTKWFQECFITEVKDYLEKKGLEFKVLLLLDNAPGHLEVSHPKVKILFLPPNTTSLIQPLDQGIIATFKKYYIKHSFRHILDIIDQERISVTEAWRLFTIRDCVSHIEKSLQDMRKSTLNACWKSIWPECVVNEKQDSEQVASQIILMAHALGGEGFDDFGEKDIEELVADTTLKAEELVEIVEEEEIHAADDQPDELTLDALKTILDSAENLEKEVMTRDPCIERAVSFKNDLKYCMARYKELYNLREKLEQDNQQPIQKRSRVISDDSE